MSSHIITPGPYRATKLWNEVTRLFRAGMPLGKHRHAFRTHASCFTATAAVNWLHQLLCSNSNFGPDVTRQQTVQLLKKFLKNHVIEDVKGRWGTEDLEDNNTLYRFPSSSPLKSIPSPAQTAASGSLKRSLSIIDKEGFFRMRSLRKNDKETQENVDPAFQSQAGEESRPMEGQQQQQQRQELTEETEHEVWKHVTLTHLQKILGLASLDDVLDPHHVNPQTIIHNMTRVNKHGVVSLEDKTNDLPHWVLSAMKSLANWPKYDSGQPSYPGFERDVFKTVSDYFYSLPQPLLTYQLYELFINVLALCGYVTPAPPPRHGKRKLAEPPSRPPPTKASFRSTECLLLSLLRQGSCDEADSPMKEVFSARVRSQLVALKGGTARLRRQHEGGSCLSLSQPEGAAAPGRLRPRSCSLETVLDDSAPLFLQQQLFLSGAGSAALPHVTRGDGAPSDASSSTAVTTPSLGETALQGAAAKRRSAPLPSATRRPRLLRPQSVGSCLDVARETAWDSRATSRLHANTPRDRPPPPHPTVAHGRDDYDDDDDDDALRGPQTASAASSVPAIPCRWLSSLELFKPPVCLLPSAPRPPQRTQSLLQPQCERVAVEALQLCTLLLPPASRRKLQLLMRMMSRISQNVDMPRLHHAIGTRTLMVHTFSGCVLGSAEGCDLDELLSTRLVSFLMDHQDSILSVPKYLLSAVTDHIHYLRAAQLPVSLVCDVSVPVTSHAFCRQISNAEFEEQKVLSSQKAMEELLEILLTNQNISEKERHKKLKQFQKQYPDIYIRRFPAAEGEIKQRRKPKIKPPLLNIKKTKAYQSSIRN